MTLEFLYEESVELVRQASQLSLKWFQSSSLEVELKGDGSPVTAADKAVEDYLRQEIERRWPEDGIVGEERPPKPTSSGRTWIIDPIDGTKSFTCGVPLYATLLALSDTQGMKLGIISLPALDETVSAVRHGGCHYNGQPTTINESSQTVCLSGLEYLPATAQTALLESGHLIRTWGDAYGYALLATGRAGAMIDHSMNLWDVAPLLVIIPESGGNITSWSGKPDPQGGSVLAGNERLHSQLTGLLAKHE